MKEIILGYARISLASQSIDRQITNLKKINNEIIIFQEAFSSKTLERPQFQKMLSFAEKELKKGNKVKIIFDSVSRMSRDAEEGSNLYYQLEEKGIELVFLNEPYINTETYRKALELSLPETDNKMIEAILNGIKQAFRIKAKEDIKLAFIQAEKELLDIRERTKQGLREAKAKGKQIGRKEGSKVETKRAIEVKEKLLKHSKKFGGSMTDKEFMEAFNVSKTTLVKYKRLITKN
ncbi:MAG: recombinase family protein [Fusobacteriaceae bacterium]|nr:recombinase family protein [Fusobacteriaceae bacterium]MBN2838022.1 recombinase family protein [Fusobacteriaceae bacterium]